MRPVLLAMLVALGLTPLGATAQGCGAAPAAPCEVGAGQYRIALPEGTAPAKALVWLHGAGGSANGVMKNQAWLKTLHARGYALIAPEGILKNYTKFRKNWAVHDGRDYFRDDIAFLHQIVDDAVARHGIDRNRILLGGFSRGGSMVWDVACRSPDLARAFAPVAGAFWEPMWQSCEAPVDLFHSHGWTDRTVPLEGRPLRGGALIQGDVFQSLYTLRETNGCANRQPEDAPVGDAKDRWFRSWTDCTGGKRIDLMLHPGGHGVPRGWLDRALNWFEARLQEDCTATALQSGVAPACG